MRFALLVAGGIFFCGSLPAEAPPEPPQDRRDARAYDPSGVVRNAVRKGLAYLAGRQNPDGSWSNRVGYKLYESYYGDEFKSVSVTALACMALIADGNVPGRGRYGLHVARGVAWLLSKVREEDGYITHAGSRMYSHAFATLLLAEVYGMIPRMDLKRKLQKAVNLIVNSQNQEGGWRYQPIPVDADLSVTVSTLQALRAARNAGIRVPLKTIERAVRYVESCSRTSGFSYQKDLYESDTRVSFALTACGIVALYSAGKYYASAVHNALNGLPYHRKLLVPGRLHYYYGHYYASQAMYLAGGVHWEAYYPSVCREILNDAGFRERGYWEDDVGVNYATAMACIILQIPFEYLPLFQK